MEPAEFGLWPRSKLEGEKSRNTGRRPGSPLYCRAHPGRGWGGSYAGIRYWAGDSSVIPGQVDILLVMDEVICGFGRTGEVVW